ncbi:hypothetical protein [Chryseobacterium arthrosphaerae]|uniref:hypothetical protein n=1 Tax=Chryseobacterium arthrosphaerae TaxID=651561 RepID=UPI001F4A17F9|nr:hypothetical protein [Chryseobacterium arthrosphaerae]
MIENIDRRTGFGPFFIFKWTFNKYKWLTLVFHNGGSFADWADDADFQNDKTNAVNQQIP